METFGFFHEISLSPRINFFKFILPDFGLAVAIQGEALVSKSSISIDTTFFSTNLCKIVSLSLEKIQWPNHAVKSTYYSVLIYSSTLFK